MGAGILGIGQEPSAAYGQAQSDEVRKERYEVVNMPNKSMVKDTQDGSIICHCFGDLASYHAKLIANSLNRK